MVPKCSRIHAAVRARKEQEATAQGIEEARAAASAVLNDSDDDTAPPNGFDEISDEICTEDGYESEDLDEEAW